MWMCEHTRRDKIKNEDIWVTLVTKEKSGCAGKKTREVG